MSTFSTDGQSLLDVALQQYGSFEALFDLADAQGLSITDALGAGTLLATPASAATDPTSAGIFAARAYRVNTGGGLVPDTAATAVDFTPADFSSTDFK